MLSWFYALCSQVIIPLPFNLVPVSLQPLPLFLAASFFGWHAVNAYCLYLIQGAFGLPFFAGLQGGLFRLLGPTGGYLLGFGAAMIWIAACRKYTQGSWAKSVVALVVANGIVFSLGLAQLSLFVPGANLLAAGFYPFIVGDFGLKLVAFLLVQRVMGIAQR